MVAFLDFSGQRCHCVRLHLRLRLGLCLRLLNDASLHGLPDLGLGHALDQQVLI